MKPQRRLLWIAVAATWLAGAPASGQEPESRLRLDVFEHSAREYAVGLSAHRRGDLDEAADHYRAAFESDPDFVEASVNLARIELERGELDAARRRLDEAERLRNGYPAIHGVRGLLELRAGHPEVAVRELSYARELAPDDPELLTNLGAALLERGRLAEAEQVLFRSLQLQAECPETLFDLALAQDRAGRPVEATFHYERFLALTSDEDPDREIVEQRMRVLLARDEPVDNTAPAPLEPVSAGRQARGDRP